MLINFLGQKDDLYDYINIIILLITKSKLFIKINNVLYYWISLHIEILCFENTYKYIKY